MTAQIIPFPRRPVREIPLSKLALANALGYSVRWVEMRVSEGMPSQVRGNKREFLLSECRPWVDRYELDVRARVGSSNGR